LPQRGGGDSDLRGGVGQNHLRLRPPHELREELLAYALPGIKYLQGEHRTARIKVCQNPRRQLARVGDPATLRQCDGEGVNGRVVCKRL
jgi:hypothetical protein